MRNFYVTKKQVTAFIVREMKRLNLTKNELLKEVQLVLDDLCEFPNDNKAQIKFYGRIEIKLKEI